MRESWAVPPSPIHLLSHIHPTHHHSETFKGLKALRLEMKNNLLMTLTAGSFSGIDVISGYLYM